MVRELAGKNNVVLDVYEVDAGENMGLVNEHEVHLLFFSIDPTRLICHHSYG